MSRVQMGHAMRMDESCHACIKKGRAHEWAMSPESDCTPSNKKFMSHIQPIAERAAQNLDIISGAQRWMSRKKSFSLPFAFPLLFFLCPLFWPFFPSLLFFWAGRAKLIVKFAHPKKERGRRGGKRRKEGKKVCKGNKKRGKTNWKEKKRD